MLDDDFIAQLYDESVAAGENTNAKKRQGFFVR